MAPLSGILAATTWDERIAEIRLLPQHHGKAQLTELYPATWRRPPTTDNQPIHAERNGPTR